MYQDTFKQILMHETYLKIMESESLRLGLPLKKLVS